jgi:GT2 family glycosyltransferase
VQSPADRSALGAGPAAGGTALADATPTVSAVVVSYNGGDRLLNTLQALHDQAVPLSAVIVVDNHSDDGTPRRIRERFPGVQVVDMGANVGLPAARNAGLRRAATDLVLMMDHDVYVDPECVERLVQRHRDDGAAVVCPRVRLVPERDVVQTDGAETHFVGTMVLRHAYRPAADLPTAATPVGACIGACMLLDRTRALAAGGFDEAYFFYFEDHEFGLRMRSLGHDVVCEPAAVVYHDRGAGTPGLAFRGRGAYPARRAYITIRNRVLTLLIHYRLRTLVVLAPTLVLYELASLALAVRQGHGRQWVRAWAWHVANAPAVWRRRRRVQRARTLRDRDLLVGGPLPLAPGLIRSRAVGAAVRLFSGALDAYWRVARRWIG